MSTEQGRSEVTVSREQSVRTPRSYEKHAWILLFVDGFVFLLADLWQLIQGPLDPTPAFSASTLLFRAHLFYAIGIAVVVMTLAAIPFRRWERWAWGLIWVAPVVWLIEAVLNLQADGILWPILLVAVGVALLGLLLPYRMFFSPETTD